MAWPHGPTIMRNPPKNQQRQRPQQRQVIPMYPGQQAKPQVPHPIYELTVTVTRLSNGEKRTMVTKQPNPPVFANVSAAERFHAVATLKNVAYGSPSYGLVTGVEIKFGVYSQEPGAGVIEATAVTDRGGNAVWPTFPGILGPARSYSLQAWPKPDPAKELPLIPSSSISFQPAGGGGGGGGGPRPVPG